MERNKGTGVMFHKHISLSTATTGYYQTTAHKGSLLIKQFLTSSLRTPKFFVKEFSYFLMPCHQHGLRINLLVQR